MSTQLSATDASSAETPPLRAILEVTPEAGGCAVATAAPNASDVTRSTSRGGGCDSCQSEVTVVDDGDAVNRYLSSKVTDSCACKAIERFECISEVVGVRDGSLVFSLVVSDRSALQDIVAAVRETGASVRLRRISRDVDGDSGTVELDVQSITEKQREAVELAVAEGYYETPRQTDLGELAERIGVSKSAVSQRLNAAEVTLVRELVDR